MKIDYSKPATQEEPEEQTLLEQIGDAIIISFVCLMITAIIFASL